MSTSALFPETKLPMQALSQGPPNTSTPHTDAMTHTTCSPAPLPGSTALPHSCLPAFLHLSLEVPRSILPEPRPQHPDSNWPESSLFLQWTLEVEIVTGVSVHRAQCEGPSASCLVTKWMTPSPKSLVSSLKRHSLTPTQPTGSIYEVWPTQPTNGDDTNMPLIKPLSGPGPQKGQAAMPWAQDGMGLCPYYIPIWLSGFREGTAECVLTPSCQAPGIGNVVEPLRKLAGTGWDVHMLSGRP